MVTSSSSLNPKQSLAIITVHVTNRVLHVPLGLVKMRASGSGHLESVKKFIICHRYVYLLDMLRMLKHTFLSS
jgi:hypothetical protein